jgi:hypothetical protein
MDAQHFDRIVKTVAAPASRRRLLRGLAALGLGSGVLGSASARARRAPGGADGSGVTVERTDAVCKGQPAISNRVCGASACQRFGCECAESVTGSKKCVNTSPFVCPSVDECNRNRDCGPRGVCIKVGACCGGSRNNLCVPSCR